MIYVTAIHMSTGGTHHEHIESVRWRDSADKTGESSVRTMVKFIEDGNAVQVAGPPAASVGVRTSSSGRKYIQTFADGTWTNNLLGLPRY